MCFYKLQKNDVTNSANMAKNNENMREIYAEDGIETVNETVSFCSRFMPEIICKSYAVILLYDGEEKAVNVLKKDIILSEATNSTEHLLPDLTFTGKHEELKAVRVRIVENHLLEDIVDVELCEQVYEDEWLLLEPNTYGDDQIYVELKKEDNGKISVWLTDVNTRCTYVFYPRWKEWDVGGQMPVRTGFTGEEKRNDGQQYHLNTSVGCVIKNNGREVFYNVLNKATLFSEEGYRAEIELKAQENLVLNIAICNTVNPQQTSGFSKIGQMTVACKDLLQNARIIFFIDQQCSRLEIVVEADGEQRTMNILHPNELRVKKAVDGQALDTQEMKGWVLMGNDVILNDQEETTKEEEEYIQILGDNFLL